MYFSIHLPRRRTEPRYRLDPKKTRRLRSRADYPRRSEPEPPAASGIRRLRRRLRALLCGIGVLALAAGVWHVAAGRSAAGCRESDFGPLPNPAEQTQTPADDMQQEADRIVYLTFDDGPSENTEKVLCILRREQVPASFFVIAAENNDEQLPILQETLKDGHCIGLHTCTHDYRKIYSSAEAYWTDIEALKQKLAPVCGGYAFTVLRFPGGSNNTVSRKYGGSGLMDALKAQAAEKGYTVVDWNVSAEDSVGGHPSANTIASRVIRGCRGKSSAIILMHDSATNSATVEALPTIIGWLKENGYAFDTVDHLPQTGG